MGFIRQYFADHEEQAYIAKMLVIAIALYPVEKFVMGNTFILYILLPTLVLIYLAFALAVTEKSAISILLSFISFAQLTGYERATVRANFPIVTTALIIINCAVFIGCQDASDESREYILNYYSFPPPKNELWNYPLAMITSLFLHGDTWHIVGNMLFLWTIGAVLERRLGPRRFLKYYLVLGIISSLANSLFTNFDIPAIGSSGAIFGMYGIFAVRCYFKKISFQIPILGPLPLFVPFLGPLVFLSFNIQVDSLMLFGIELALQISGSYHQLQTPNEGGIGYMAHLSGLAGGIILSFIAGFHKDAVEERYLEDGVVTFESVLRPSYALNQLNKALELNPENLEALLTKARLLAKKGPNTRAQEAYEHALSILVRNDPSEAALVLRECLYMFREFADKSLYLSLGNIMRDECDFKTAKWLYQKVITNKELDPTWREQAYFFYALVLIRTGEDDTARQYLTQFLAQFPGSKYQEVARQRLEMLCV